MDFLSLTLGLLLGLAAGFSVARLLDRFSLTSATARVAEITQQARKEAENILKAADLESKDELFRKREEFNREMEQLRGEQREQERRLEKREDGLDQKQQ